MCDERMFDCVTYFVLMIDCSSLIVMTHPILLTCVRYSVFGGFLRNAITCTRCKHVSVTHDATLDVSVDIHKVCGWHLFVFLCSRVFTKGLLHVLSHLLPPPFVIFTHSHTRSYIITHVQVCHSGQGTAAFHGFGAVDQGQFVQVRQVQTHGEGFEAAYGTPHAPSPSHSRFRPFQHPPLLPSVVSFSSPHSGCAEVLTRSLICCHASALSAQVHRAPTVLTIQLKRFDLMGGFGGKNSKFVE